MSKRQTSGDYRGGSTIMSGSWVITPGRGWFDPQLKRSMKKAPVKQITKAKRVTKRSKARRKPVSTVNWHAMEPFDRLIEQWTKEEDG